MNKKELEELIVYHQNKYYNSEPEIEDWEFDELWDELASRFPESEILKRVGNEGAVDGDKCEHVIHMGSQEKVTSYDALREWIRLKRISFPVVVQEKCDGISVELVYVNGKLDRAVTRGDGTVGKLITSNVKKMNCVPETIDIDGTIAVRGEIMLPFSNVDKLVGVESITNVRNMASGIANQKNSDNNLDLLIIVCYDVSLEIPESEKFAFLTRNKFMRTSYSVMCFGESDVEKTIELIKIHRDNERFDYQIDGVVIKQNFKPVNANVTKARPDWQRAYKFPVEKLTTELIDVEWSRNGYNFTPVAILKPVEICDTIVSRASLANYDIVRKLGVKIPCIVEVAKQNEIIPHVHSVLGYAKEAKEVVPPTVCPICGEKLYVSGTGVKCVNQECKTHIEHRIAKWIDTVGSLGFGGSTIEYLIYDCNIEHISDLYCNSIVANAIEKCSFKKRLSKAFADLWERSRNIDLCDFVSGFDIEGIGSRVVKLIVDAGYDTLEALRQVNYEDIVQIQGFGESRANIFIEQIHLLEDEMDSLLNTKRVTIKATKSIQSNIAGKTFVITGSLSKPRKFYEELLVSNGCKLGSSVTKSTSYLVTDNPNSGSSKNKKAAELNIPILNEEMFLKLFE